MSGIPLQSSIIYGPILSRRLGRSLGINLMPMDQKVCSFDCVYCQYGYTTMLTKNLSNEILPTTSAIISAVEKALKKPRTIDFVTFSGNGEPTVHPDFPEIVEAVRIIKNKYKRETKLAVLSNSSRVVDNEILTTLKQMDAPMMKLDAGDEATFHAINHPLQTIKLMDIIEGLKLIPNVMIQSMLIDGEIANIRGEPYAAWLKCLLDISPQEVFIYSTDRPTADDRVKQVSPQKLSSIKEDLQRNHQLNVEAYW